LRPHSVFWADRVPVPETDKGPDSRNRSGSRFQKHVRTEGKRNKRHTKNHIHKNQIEQNMKLKNKKFWNLVSVMLHSLQFWLWPKFWLLTDPLQGKGSILESWTLLDLGDKDPFDIFFTVAKVHFYAKKFSCLEILLVFWHLWSKSIFIWPNAKSILHGGTRIITNWQNVNRVLLGSDTVPTNTCLAGNGILRGRDAFQPVGYPNGNNTYSKGVTSFNQIGLKGSYDI